MARVQVLVNNTTQYKLTLFKKFSAVNFSILPQTIEPDQQAVPIQIDDNDRAGCCYLATDANGNEMGFVTMAFTCPKSSSNSAEGSSAVGPFISAGLQKYKESGTPANFVYSIGSPNLASWNNGSGTGDLVLSQSTLETWTRASIVVKNTTTKEMEYVSMWNDNALGTSVWPKYPRAGDKIPAGGQRIYLLNDNDRAGLYFMIAGEGTALMYFTCPKSSHNSAEGSPDNAGETISAGLQKYARTGTPVSFAFHVGQANQACWTDGSSNNGKLVIPGTEPKTNEVMVTPGFSIKNDTAWTLQISLNQVGPLYFGTVAPGETWIRNTGAVWFTIKVAILLDPTQEITEWDAVVPVGLAVGTVLMAAITAGLAAGPSTVAAASAGGVSGLSAAATTAIAGGAVGLGIPAGTSLFIGGAVVGGTVSALTAPAVTAALKDTIFTDKATTTMLSGQYAGAPWPFRSKLGQYTVTGGPIFEEREINGEKVLEPVTHPLVLNPPKD